jgi:hypothetical protein
MVSAVELNYNTMNTGPLSTEDFQRLQKEIEGIKSFLPEHLMGPFWAWYNQIRGVNEKQPCGCKSAAGHWSRCVDELRKFVRERSEQV